MPLPCEATANRYQIEALLCFAFVQTHSCSSRWRTEVRIGDANCTDLMALIAADWLCEAHGPVCHRDRRRHLCGPV
jgi:hypothetical protein